MTAPNDRITQPVVYHGHLLEYYNDYKKSPEKHDGKKWDDKEDKTLAEIKEHVKIFYLTEQFSTCVYCKQEIDVKHLGAWDAEHILPKDKYPQFLLDPKNLCLSCKDCNGMKFNEDIASKPCTSNYPRSGSAFKIIHPHFDSYEKNIRILKPGSLYQALTRKGSDTISTCGLFRFATGTNYSEVESALVEDIINISESLQDVKQSDVQLALIELAVFKLQGLKNKVISNIMNANKGLIENLTKKGKGKKM